MIKKIVITDALLDQHGTTHLHPSVKAWEKGLLSMQQRWAREDKDYLPLSWFCHTYAQQGAAASLAVLASDIPKNSKQYWVVSPYHARLTRSALRVMPESMLGWSVENAHDLCDVLSPLLSNDGMSLHTVGSAVVLACDRVWDVQVADFAAVSGGCLPDKMPEGQDAATWMMLITEMQMLLHQQPIHTAEHIQIHGVWLWGMAEHAAMDRLQAKMMQGDAVATRNVYLQSLLQQMDKECDASVIITEADQLHLLCKEGVCDAKEWILMGEGQSVSLKPSVWHKCWHSVFKQTWRGVAKT